MFWVVFGVLLLSWWVGLFVCLVLGFVLVVLDLICAWFGVLGLGWVWVSVGCFLVGWVGGFCGWVWVCCVCVLWFVWVWICLCEVWFVVFVVLNLFWCECFGVWVCCIVGFVFCLFGDLLGCLGLGCDLIWVLGLGWWWFKFVLVLDGLSLFCFIVIMVVGFCLLVMVGDLLHSCFCDWVLHCMDGLFVWVCLWFVGFWVLVLYSWVCLVLVVV